jgi:hypothetical protein
MYNSATIIGSIREIVRGEKDTTVVIEDTSTEKPKLVPVSCWGGSDKLRPILATLEEGQLVSITGYNSGNKSSQGRWFSEFKASFIKVMSPC